VAQSLPGAKEKRGLMMAAGLVWRTVLFFGLIAGYVILSALPYLT
jgi:hypothetical protein